MVKIEVEFDPSTKVGNVKAPNMSPMQAAFILSQIITTILHQEVQTAALLINPLEGIGINKRNGG